MTDSYMPPKPFAEDRDRDRDRRGPPRHEYDREGRRLPPREDHDGRPRERMGRDPRDPPPRDFGGRRDDDRERRGGDPRRPPPRDEFGPPRRRYDDEDRPPRGGGRRDEPGGYGGGRGRHDDFGGRDSGRRGRDEGGRGRGPPKDRAGTPEKRSPTPPGSMPISQRRRKASGWDVHAPGYEAYTAMQAKATGYFNLPGANRQHTVAINFPAPAGVPPPPASRPPVGVLPSTNPNLARQARRLYIGSITPDTSEENLTSFFNEKLSELGIAKEGEEHPLLAVQVNHEKSYAFIEFRTAEDATAAMALDGVIFLGVPLKIRRPKDYLSATDLAAVFGGIVPGVVSTNVPDSINKIFVGGLPTYLNEAQVMELLQSFGELRAFNLVKDGNTGLSKGFAFFEYMDPGVTDIACQGLNGMELGDRFLVVQRASIGANPNKPGMPNMPGYMPNMPPRPTIVGVDDDIPPSTTLLLLNMVTADELVDDTEYNEIIEDIREELGKYGRLENLLVPRPVKKDKKWAPGDTASSQASAAAQTDAELGVGRVYVKFDRIESAGEALRHIAGRQFGGRSIIATYVQEDIFGSGAGLGAS